MGSFFTRLILSYKLRSIDICAKKEYNYIYNEGTLIEAITYNIELNGENIVEKTVTDNIRYVYDSEGNMTKKIITSADGKSFTYNYETADDKTVVKFDAVKDKVSAHSKSDSFGRKTFDELQLGSGFISRQFEYVMGKATNEHTESGKLKSSPTTQLVSRILLSDGRTIEYEYDAEERITKVTDSVDGTTEYTYDALGQLLTERLNGHIINSMTYDTYGNISSKNGQTYFYDSTWHDLLTSIESESIEYDAQGNPKKYLGHTLTWEKGRQLKSFDTNTYTYNANGIRTSKTINGVKHEYTLDGTKILKETWGDNTLIPLYDNEDSVCGIIYNDYAYYFLKNLQGDIIAITNNKGRIVASYTYDAWGVCTIVSDNTGIIARVNPFRYRGYYYDVEIGLYYLQSRYYDPNVSRFINGDDPEQAVLSLGIYYTNIFSYCSNKAICNADHSGRAFFTALLVGFAIGAIVSGVATVISNKKKGKNWYDGLAISMLAGGVGGAISCISIPGVSTWVCAAVFGAAGNLTTKVILGEIKSIKDVKDAILQGAIAGLIGNAAAKCLNKIVSAKFAKWPKAKQKSFLSSIGKITNRQLRAIRQAIKNSGSTKVIEKSIEKVIEKYGYALAVSAFISSTATSI